MTFFQRGTSRISRDKRLGEDSDNLHFLILLPVDYRMPSRNGTPRRRVHILVRPVGFHRMNIICLCILFTRFDLRDSSDRVQYRNVIFPVAKIPEQSSLFFRFRFLGIRILYNIIWSPAAINVR